MGLKGLFLKELTADSVLILMSEGIFSKSDSNFLVTNNLTIDLILTEFAKRFYFFDSALFGILF